jgi:hypothetical protein
MAEDGMIEWFWDLMKRFDWDPDFETDYRAATKNTLDKGYSSW